MAALLLDAGTASSTAGGWQEMQDSPTTDSEENSSLWRQERDFAGEGKGTHRVQPQSDNATAAIFNTIADLGMSQQKTYHDAQENPCTVMTKH